MNRKTISISFIVLLCMTLGVGFDAGKTAYTKHLQTPLLKEPQPLAESVSTLPMATGVKIIALQGNWARVSSGSVGGWIYLGNLAEKKPAVDHSIQGLQLAAGQTTASVAARPLDNVTAQYDSQEGLGDAANDVQWLETQSDAISSTNVIDYLKANKKGEFQ